MPQLPVQVVDATDLPLRGARKQEVWSKGLRHRVIRIMLEDEQGSILLQKRVSTKELFPDCWDNSVAGHVDEGEDYLTAAKRELSEEIGLKGVNLTEIKHYTSDGTYKHRILKRWTTFYKATIPRSTVLELKKDEVSEVRWVSREKLSEMVTKQQSIIADGLAEAYDILYKPCK